MQKDWLSPQTWRINSMKLVFAVLLLIWQLIGPIRPILAAESKASWQAEWDRTVRAAEQEGQVTVSIGGYGAIIDSGVFQKTYPKIKVTHMTGAGTDLTQRISAGRQISCRRLQRRWKFTVSGSLSGKDARPDQVSVDPAGDFERHEMVGRQ